MKKYLLILFLFSLLQGVAQPPSKFFNKFGGLGIDIGYGVKETYDRQYIVAGSTSSWGNGGVDAQLLLIDSMGQLKWSKTYGGVLSDVAKSVVVNPADSGFIFTGHTSSFGNGGYDVYVVRTDKNGVVIWQKSFGGLDWDFGKDIVFAPDGNLVICGNTHSMGYGKKDGYVLKVNLGNGALMWQKYFGGSENDELVSVLYTSDALFSLCGTKTTNDINNDFWLLKLSVNGDSILSKSITSFTTNEKCYDFIEDKNSNLIFCGALDTTVAMTEKYSSYALKTNLNGVFISQISFTNGATPDERFHSICNTKSDNTVSMSRKIFQGFFKLNSYVFKAINDFTYISSPTYGDVEDEELFNIENTSDDGYIMVGYTKSYQAVAEDIYVIKLDNSTLNSSSVIGIKENLQTIATQEFYYNKNKLYFNNSTNAETIITIYNIMGESVSEGVTNNESFDINLQKQGVYFAVLKNGERFSKLKFIVHY